MNLGLIILGISALGYISNWLNWRFLNYKVVHLLYYIGAFVHETSHALLCLLTGAKIIEYKVFVKHPHVSYAKSAIPILGNVLIAFAPIAGGLLFLYAINKFFLSAYFMIPQFSGWQNIFGDAFRLLAQLNITHWQILLALLLFLNVGAMIGPSFQDLKNIWPILIVLFFAKSEFLGHLGLLAIILILTNIIIQLILAAIVSIARAVI